MSVQQFRLPDAGEGLTEAEIVSWKVRPGDRVEVNDVIVEVETAKALTELPCPFAGVVGELLVPEGSTVSVGTPIITVATGADPRSATGADSRTAPGINTGINTGIGSEADADVGGIAGAGAQEVLDPGGSGPVLVGYGPQVAAPRRRRSREHPPVPDRFDPVAVPAPTPARRAAAPVLAGTGAAAPAPGSGGARRGVLAKPPVRKLASDLGVDLASVAPTGPGGIVTRGDVEHAARTAVPGGPSGAGSSSDVGAGPPGLLEPPVAEPAAPGWDGAPSPGPRETRIPVHGVRRHTARAMVASAFTAPHVTEWLSVDLTRAVRLVKRLREDPAFDAVRVGPLLLVARAVLLAVRRHPGINASWDEAAGEIVIKHYVNLGVAASTPRGLLVPNIKAADRMSLPELAIALSELTAAARAGRTPAADLAGGTITLTNIGVFGVDAGTPILNPGEAAILALGQVRRMPWVHKGRVRPRWVTQLAVSFDHRFVDGDLGSRFLAEVGALLTDPAQALARG